MEPTKDCWEQKTRIVGNNLLRSWERARCGWRRGSCGGRAAPFWDKHPYFSSWRWAQEKEMNEVEKWAWTVGWSGQPKTSDPFAEGFGRIDMIINLHRKQETYFQGRGSLYRKWYLHQAWLCTPGPWTLAVPTVEQGHKDWWCRCLFLSFFLFFFLFWFFFLINFLLSSSYPFIQNPLPFPYTLGQGLTHQFPCQLCNLLLKLCEFLQILWLLLFL